MDSHHHRVDQQVNDTTAADQGYTVDDATGSAPGWHSTVSATTFTTGGGTPHTLADAGTFSTNGSVTSISGTGAPTTACASGSTCTVPTNTTTYPVAITTAAATPTAFTIYDTSAGTGSGTIDIGGSTAANPVGWWLNMPANTPARTPPPSPWNSSPDRNRHSLGTAELASARAQPCPDRATA